VTVSPDGCTLYFTSSRDTGNASNFRLYQATRGSSIPSSVTTTLKIVGTGSVTTAPYQCSSNCTFTGTPDTTVALQSSASAMWTGSCAPHAGNPSADGVFVFVNGGVCTVTFQSGNPQGSGGGCDAPSDCQQGLECTLGTCRCPSGAACSAQCPCGSGGSCTSPSQCQQGLECTNGTCVPNHCANQIKDGDEAYADCGGSCPACPCGLGCAEKQCGDPDPTDNCGFPCVGICDNGQVCSADSECPPGSECMLAGPQMGFSPSTRICLPAVCREMDPYLPNCGVPPGVDCGPCPTCVPRCEGKSCGDDGCGGLCGPTPGGSFCSGLGILSTKYTPSDDHSSDFPIQPPVALDPDEVGALPATFAVADNGMANYSIPIQVPPGRGVEPALTLSYASTKIDGMLGIGWSLTGLSTITRCPRTIAQDDITRPVELTKDDRFCLDGQRIVLPAEVAYGDPSDEYRTELETFSRITLHGPIVDSDGEHRGPTGFTVEFRDGRILTYGAPGVEPGADPAHSIVGAGRILKIWGLTKVEDRAGRSMSVVYSTSAAERFRVSLEPNSSGELLPRTISYGPATVEFKYSGRNDPRRQYASGFSVFTKNLLREIETRVEDRVVRRYHLEYPGSTVLSGEPTVAHLRSVKVCAPLLAGSTQEKCLPETVFDYDESAGVEPTEIEALGQASAAVITLDADGDGRDDLLMSGGWSLVRSAPDSRDPLTLRQPGLLALPEPPSGSAIDPEQNPTCVSQDSVADINLDVRQDLVNFCTGQTHFAQEDSATGNISYVVAGPELPMQGGRLADLDGDGFKDLIGCFREEVEGVGVVRQARYWRNMGLGYSSSTPVTLPGFSSCPDLFAMDVNGDGDEELIQFPSPGEFGQPTLIDLGPQGPTATPLPGGESWDDAHIRIAVSSFPFDTANDEGLIKVVDINGDGLKDFVQLTTRPVDIYLPDGGRQRTFAIKLGLNTGRGFTTRYVIPDGGLPNPLAFRDVVPFDYDGDGREDLVGHYLVMRSTVDQNFEITLDPDFYFTQVQRTTGDTIVMDADGDGNPDLLTRPVSSGSFPQQFELRSGHTGTTGFMTEIVDGLGKRTVIRYAPFDDAILGNARTYVPRPGNDPADGLSVRLNRVAPLVSLHAESQITPVSGGVALKRGAVYRYHYHNAALGSGQQNGGRGWFGFRSREIRIQEEENGAFHLFSHTKRDFHNDTFWRMGRVSLEQTRMVRVGAGQWHEPYQRVSRVINDWQLRTTPRSDLPFTWLAGTIAQEYEAPPSSRRRRPKVTASFSTRRRRRSQNASSMKKRGY
jgi:hypothetical protein